jgi:hypothetical protein
MTLRPVAPESDPHARFEPKLLTVLREGYSAQQFLRDLLAGLQVGIVALPLSIALAIASGVRPEQGLYTAIVAGFLISLLGGSRVQIGGPTGAFIVIVYGVVQKFGYPGLAVATMMAGGILVVMGLARLGSVIKFVPYPVTVGFTSGIALIIAAAQVRDQFGLQLAAVPADFVEKLAAYAGNAATWSPWALGVGLATLAILVFFPRHRRGRLHGRGVHPDAFALHEAARGQLRHHPGEHLLVRLERQAGAASAQPGMVGHPIAQPEPEKIPQRQAVGAAPLQAALAVDALEVAHQMHPEVAAGRQRPRPHDRGVVRPAELLDEAVEPGLPEHRLQPVVEHVPRRLRQLVPGHQHLTLPWPLPPHRHAWHSALLPYRQRISRRPDFVNGLLDPMFAS